MDSIIGSTIDEKFLVQARLGVGGLGTVFRAEQVDLDRAVALKVLHPNIIDDNELTTRFLQEAKILAELSHPNIVKVYSFGVTQDSLPYMAMELLDGRTLDYFIRNKLLSWQEVLDVAIQICDAVHYAHRNSIVHRDIKPANVMVKNASGQNSVKVLDFGLSKIIHNSDTLNRLTQTGTLIGSVNYMSPELCAGGKADERSDIYSFACLLYECIAGEPPLVSDNPLSTVNLQINQMPVRLSKRKTQVEGFPEELEKIIFKALQKKPEKRFASMKELFDALCNLRDGRAAELDFSSIEYSSGGWTVAKPSVSICVGIIIVSMLGFYFSQANLAPRKTSKKLLALPVDDRTRHQFKARALLKDADTMIKEKRFKAALALVKRAAGEVALRCPASRGRTQSLQDLYISRELAKDLIAIGPTSGFPNDMDELKMNNTPELSGSDYGDLLSSVAIIQAYLGVILPSEFSLLEAVSTNYRIGRKEEIKKLIEQIAIPQKSFELGADTLVLYWTIQRIVHCYALACTDISAARKEVVEIEKELRKKSADLTPRWRRDSYNPLAQLYLDLGFEEDYQRIALELIPIGKQLESGYPGSLMMLAGPLGTSLDKSNKKAQRLAMFKDLRAFYEKLIPTAKNDYTLGILKSSEKQCREKMR